VAHDVFHHDHRAIHDHAEIQRSQRKQVGGIWRNCRQMDANSSAKGMVSATMSAPRDIAQKEEQDDGYQDHAFGRLCRTVCVVYSHQIVCGRGYGTIFTPGGRICSFNSLTISVDAIQGGFAVPRLCAERRCLRPRRYRRQPLSVDPMNGLADLAQPDLRSLLTWAISPMRSGVPFCDLMSVFSMSRTLS
jgi:hypothetical protein